jgi:hypothetical protein
MLAAEQIHHSAHPGQHRCGGCAQLPDMTEREGPHKRAQRGRRPHPWHQFPDGALAQTLPVIDAVGAGDHPRDDGRNFRGGAEPSTAGDGEFAGDLGVQTGVAGQPHPRDQPGRADQVGFIEAGSDARTLAQLHLAGGLLFGLVAISAITIFPVERPPAPSQHTKSHQFTRWIQVAVDPGSVGRPRGIWCTGPGRSWSRPAPAIGRLAQKVGVGEPRVHTHAGQC